MRRLIVFFLIVVAVLVTMALTVPDREKHVQAIDRVIAYVVKDLMPDIEAVGDSYEFIGMAYATKSVSDKVQGMLTVKQQRLWSVGKIEYQGRQIPVSLGIFGHAFTIPKKLATKVFSNFVKDYFGIGTAPSSNTKPSSGSKPDSGSAPDAATPPSGSKPASEPATSVSI